MEETTFGGQATREMTVSENASTLRNEIKALAVKVKNFKNRTQERGAQAPEDRPEELANITLAYRHLEDAAMRLGKAIQAADGGTSVYDK